PLGFGADVMFGGPAGAFADAYSAHAPTHVYRFDHFGWSLRVLGLGATHGSEIVHRHHSYASFLGRKLHPRGRGRRRPPRGRGGPGARGRGPLRGGRRRVRRGGRGAPRRAGGGRGPGSTSR